MSDERLISERKKKWNTFMEGKQKSENIVMIDYLEGLEEKPYIVDGQYEKNYEWIMKKYFIMKDNVSWLHDDTIPYIDMLTGTEIFAEAFGCKVKYPADNNPFALHKIESVSEISKLKVPNLWDTRLSDLFELAYQLKEKTEQDAVIRLPDIQSPIDIAALIMNKEEFYIGLIEDTEAIKELISKTHTLLTQFLDEWFRAFGKAFVAHFPSYYMEYGITLSEDEVGVVNADIFEEMFLPGLNALSNRYGRIGIHCCATSRHQWHHMKTIQNLCLLNLGQPPIILKDAYEFFKDTCGQMHGSYAEGEPETWKDKLPKNARIVFQLTAHSREDAMRKLSVLREL